MGGAEGPEVMGRGAVTGHRVGVSEGQRKDLGGRAEECGAQDGTACRSLSHIALKSQPLGLNRCKANALIFYPRFVPPSVSHFTDVQCHLPELDWGTRNSSLSAATPTSPGGANPPRSCTRPLLAPRCSSQGRLE